MVKRKKSRGRKIDFTGEKEEEEVADDKGKEEEEDKEGGDEKKEDKEANEEEKEETALGLKKKIRQKTRRRKKVKKVGNSATRKVEEREDAPLTNFARQDQASYASNHPQRVNTFLPNSQDNSAAKENLPSVDTFWRNNPDTQVI